MKRAIAFFVCILMVLAMTACGQTGKPAESTASTEAPSEAKSEAEATVPTWPTAKNIDLICAAGTGGNTNAQCRILADYWTRTISGKNFVVTNESTGSGTVAFETVRSANPDGNTLLFYHNGIDIMKATKKYDYGTSDFTILGVMVDKQSAYCVVVSANSKYNSMKDLIAAAEANPGTITTGTMLGASREMLIGSLSAATSCDFKAVESGNEAETITSLLGGNLDFAFISLNNSLQYQEAGQMKILAYCDEKRTDFSPDTPTIKEDYPEFNNIPNIPVLLGPAGMDEALADAINASFKGMETDTTSIDTYGTLKQQYTWFDRQTSASLLENYRRSIDIAAAALGY